MKKQERLVFFYDLVIEAYSRTFDAPQTISVKKAIELMERVDREQWIKEQAKGRERLYVSDYHHDGNTVSFLINKSDTEISDPVFTIPNAKQRRVVAKVEQEGQDFSVHAIIRLADDELEPALVLIEHCNGLGFVNIQRLLNQILQDATKVVPLEFEQNHPDGALDSKGRPKKINVKFKTRFDGHVSNELKKDLNEGKVQSIELITERQKFTPFDEDGYIKEKCKTLVLTLKDEEHPILDKYSRIVGVVKKNRDTYDKARIKFKSPEGLERTVEMNSDEGLEKAYVKRARLDGFQSDLSSSYEKFEVAILEKMKALLVED
ncbi:hypothetical protein [Advenella sp. FME57]|uniref:hypothetical protein n=1 Tax=Advenella sp. FME57 TaxID=2742604 RepID=UPI001867F00B|nr:hypothetical protein [Advenella sp. FME57]